MAVLILASQALQTLLFLTVANPDTGTSKDCSFNTGLVLFTTAFCANMIGLNISSAFNSAITIYIVIPCSDDPDDGTQRRDVSV
ncbi:MAG: hypothetical protein MZV63_67580 [Marinilabiliales bacterium]|nr:hypothetical protein [Marinilabiliales bacterium]